MCSVLNQPCSRQQKQGLARTLALKRVREFARAIGLTDRKKSKGLRVRRPSCHSRLGAWPGRQWRGQVTASGGVGLLGLFRLLGLFLLLFLLHF